MSGTARRPARTGATAPRAGGPGWRGLGLFWAAVLALLGGGGGVLQWLGPPQAPPPIATPAPGQTAIPPPAAPPAPAGSAEPARVAEIPPSAVPLPPLPAGPPVPHPVAAPDPALSAPAPDLPGHVLPRIGADGRTSMAVYAGAFDAADPRPRVGLILAGVGLNEAASLAAIRTLPAGITLAVSAYAARPGAVLAAARAAGHEYLVSIPMEPHSFPLNDPGNHALLTSQTPAQNRRALDWALSRFAGYVGATGALGLMRGERFAGSPEDMDPVLQQLAGRGLLYVDPRPDAPRLPFTWGRDVDVVIDNPGNAAAIDAALARLDRIAQLRGRALGLVGAVRPVTVARLAAWANGLATQGLALAPVTALALPPPAAPAGDPHP